MFSGSVYLGRYPLTVGDDYSDITFFWTCETNDLGANDYSAGDTTGGYNGNTAITTDAVKIGSKGLSAGSGDGTHNVIFVVSSGDLYGGNPLQCRVGFWLYPTGNGSQYLKPFSFGDALYGTDFGALTIQEDGGNYGLKVDWNDADGDETISIWNQTNGNLFNGTYNTWYFIEIIYDNGTVTMIRDGDTGDTAVATFTDMDSVDFATLRFATHWFGTEVMYMDNIMISSDITRDLYALRNLTESPR
jgi:hypothetical protein